MDCPVGGRPSITLVGGLVAALGGPITLVGAALIAALAVAWSTNLFGIRDWTRRTWATISSATTLFLTNLSAAWTRNITENPHGLGRVDDRPAHGLK